MTDRTSPAGAEEADVRLLRVGKSFGTVRAVDDVGFSVAPGQFLTLLGPSGCGKTTTLRMIGGFEAPDSGELWVAGRRLADTPDAARVTRMVFQSYALFPHMTVTENVAYGLRRQRVKEPDLGRRTAAALESVGIAEKARSYPRELSGGQQQRVALARALVTRPRVLLLDEPLGALDLKMRRRMQAELKALQREVGITFIYVTHDQEEALALSDRIIVMERGRIAQDGTPEAIYHRPVSPYVADFIGETNLLEGEVAGTAGDDALAVVIGGHRVLGVSADAAGGPGVGARAVLAVRPERLRVGPAEEAGGLPARVIGTVFLGTVHRVTLAGVGGAALRADLPVEAGLAVPAPGQAVNLLWDTADARIFPRAQG